MIKIVIIIIIQKIKKKSEILLPLPKTIIPITKIGINDIDSNQCPFFGYAPSETSIRICICPKCNYPISVSHIHLHLQSHKEEKKMLPKPNSTIPLSNTKIFSQIPSTYSDRQSYTFRVLFDDK